MTKQNRKDEQLRIFDLLGSLSSDIQNRLSRFISDVRNGRDNILTTPLFDKNPNILLEWDKIFEELSAEAKLPDILIENESAQRSKFGPRSIAIPWKDRRDSLLAYFKPGERSNNISKITPPSIGRLRPLQLQNVRAFIKTNTNSGLPYLAKKGTVVDVAIKNIGDLLVDAYPAVLFTRTQEGNKTRNVWGFPIADTIQEMLYYRPLLDYQRQQPWRSAIVSPEAVNTGVTTLMNHAKSNDLSIVSIDFSAYDASLKPYLIREGFNYIKLLYQNKYHPDIDRICERFISIGIITPEGTWTGEHGVPSGSTFTNEIDSLCQYLIALSYPNEKLEHFQIQGDDGLYACKDPKALMEWFNSFGLNVNMDKSRINKQDCSYLQLMFHPTFVDGSEFVGVYSTYRAILRLCYLETFTDFTKDDLTGKDYFAIRSLSILENCKYHPYFEQLVKFVVERDKYSLAVSDQGLSNYIKFRERQDGRDINFNIYQYGDYPVGIKNFESYKLVKKLMS